MIEAFTEDQKMIDTRMKKRTGYTTTVFGSHCCQGAQHVILRAPVPMRGWAVDARVLAASVSLFCVAWMPLARAQFMNQGSSGEGGQGFGTSWMNLLDSSGRRFESEADGPPPTTHPLAEEYRVVVTPSLSASGTEAMKTLPKTGRTDDLGMTCDQQMKRYGFVQLRTDRIHPQPNLRHAVGGYEPHRSGTPAEVRIRSKLALQMEGSLDCQEMPLRALLVHLTDETGVPFVADIRALTDSGIDIDGVTVTQKIRGVSLQSALRLLLRELDLTYVIKDEVLLITTKDMAQENLSVLLYPFPGRFEPRRLVDLIQSVVAAQTWDSVGGAGSIKILSESNCMAILQTEEIHEEVISFLKALDSELAPSKPVANVDPKALTTRVYPVRDDNTLQALQRNLVSLCNAALGEAGDPKAKVLALAGKLVVQSDKRSFHVYAGEMIRAIHGVDVTTPEYFGVSGAVSASTGGQNSINSGMNFGGGMGGMGGFCWVARAVYGADDPRWLVFRGWIVTEAPAWLRHLYGVVGPDVAVWLQTRPVARGCLQSLMDTVVEPRLRNAAPRMQPSSPM